MRRSETDRGLYGFGTVTAWVVLALILLFAGLSIALITLGGQAYRSIQDTAEENAQRRASVSYVIGRLCAFDVQNAVRVETMTVDGEAVDVLILSEDIDGEVYETRIFCAGRMLREQFVPAEAALESAEDGERIAQLNSFSAQIQSRLVKLSFEHMDGETETVHAVLRSGQGG